ncbi:MAG: hypothetical protein ACK4G3_05945, partial [bacterium]
MLKKKRDAISMNLYEAAKAMRNT